MDHSSRIYIAGHPGLVGSAIWSNLCSKGYRNLLGRSRKELDLLDQQAVARFFASEKPEYVVLAAAKVGGIIANNTYRADFIYENLQIQNNVIHHSWLHGVKKLLFLGSTCIYPREAPQPLSEDSLLTGPLESTNEPYAIAKIAGLKMCESYNLQYGTNFIAVMPANLYGPNDNFDLEKSHVLPAMIRKIYLGKCLEEENWEAVRLDLQKRPVDGEGRDWKQMSSQSLAAILSKYGLEISDSTTAHSPRVRVNLWGTGRPLREFLWSEEMADASVHILEKVNFSDLATAQNGKPLSYHINIGTGEEISIRDLAFLVKETVGFRGEIRFDSSKPDGTMRKVTDTSRLQALGWRHTISVSEGVPRLYHWYLTH